MKIIQITQFTTRYEEGFYILFESLEEIRQAVKGKRIKLDFEKVKERFENPETIGFVLTPSRILIDINSDVEFNYIKSS